ncbi:hypothetical protein ACQKGL_24560 [Ensifer adhaerens]|uniref:hypothetical protein n=1 Tax=Ensifer adhaerens TaxID=106592 RepID=UPI003D014364
MSSTAMRTLFHVGAHHVHQFGCRFVAILVRQLGGGQMHVDVIRRKAPSWSPAPATIVVVAAKITDGIKSRDDSWPALLGAMQSLQMAESLGLYYCEIMSCIVLLSLLQIYF